MGSPLSNSAASTVLSEALRNLPCKALGGHGQAPAAWASDRDKKRNKKETEQRSTLLRSLRLCTGAEPAFRAASSPKPCSAAASSEASAKARSRCLCAVRAMPGHAAAIQRCLKLLGARHPPPDQDMADMATSGGLLDRAFSSCSATKGIRSSTALLSKTSARPEHELGTELTKSWPPLCWCPARN